MTKQRTAALVLILCVLLFVSVLLGLMLGSVPLSASEVLGGLFGAQENSTAATIVFTLRLPRVLGALLSGAGLAVAGLLLQSATDNDLCSPNVIGVNSGAGFAVMVFLCLFPMAFDLLPLAAFVGAFVTALVVLGVSFSLGHHTSKTTVVLAGVAVGSLLSAGTSFLSQLFPDVLSSYSAFSTGGFAGLYLSDLPVPALLIVVGILAAQGLAPRLNLLCLGDELAQGLGVRVQRVRLLALMLSCALCAAVVSFAGLLGFVGLIVPHMARRVAGSDLRVLTGVSALCGAVLVVLADLAGRTLFAPADLPAGILMAVLGAPFFLFLLFKRRRTA